eukprot:5325415-Lingulodinium_polyedra.AAC.2
MHSVQGPGIARGVAPRAPTCLGSKVGEWGLALFSHPNKGGPTCLGSMAVLAPRFFSRRAGGPTCLGSLALKSLGNSLL